MRLLEKINPDRLRTLFIFFIYFFASWVILLAFIAYPRVSGSPPHMFGDMVYGKAHRPFVYRTLIPSTVRLITEITPKVIENKVEKIVMARRTIRRLAEVSQIEEEYIYEYFVALAIIYCCFFGFALTIRQLIKTYYKYPDFVADLAPLGALLIIPAFFRYDNTLYDPATIILFALCLLLITKRKWMLFYPVYILASINKETSLLLAGVFLVYCWKDMKKPYLAGHLILQGAIWLTAKLIISHYFQDNPGGVVEFHLFDHNLILFTRAYRSLYFIVFMGLYIILIGYRWNEKSIMLRRGFLVTFIPIFIAGMLVGYIDEVRIFYEAFPFAFLLALPTVVEIFGRSKEPSSGAILDEIE